MERRDEGREREMPNSMSYIPTPQMSSQKSPPVKLPLAPIISTPPDRRGNKATVSIRRGSSIFSPTQTQTLDPPPPPPQQHHKEPNPDPDPAQTPTGPTNFQNPPQQQQSQQEGNNNSSTTTTAVIRYRECLKNHAASMGGHVVDGCGEFMPSGGDGTPESLHCAACDCHRNFHRKEVDSHRDSSVIHGRAPRQHNKHAHSYSHGPTMVNFGGGGGAVESSSEDLNIFQSSGGGHAVIVQPSHNYNYNNNNNSSGGSKKRHRTKFSQEQKDKMQDLAERLGWRMQKQNEGEVEQFCSQTGVKRQVFKVWMHNNKQAMKKRQP